MPVPDLGIAGKFNAFILGDMQGYHSDVEGRLAVGGNLTLENYSIGKQLPNSSGARDDLVVGGKAEFENGRMYSGNAAACFGLIAATASAPWPTATGPTSCSQAAACAAASGCTHP